LSVIKPKLLRGLRDYMPGQMLARQRMVLAIRKVYESYGFVPIDTPAIEAIEVLTGQYGGESELGIFKFDDPDGYLAGLRFDLTVPLARFMAMYPELPKPFKRYHMATVWRADKPEPGRFREFIQFDADIVGTSSMAADTEIVAIIHDTLNELGLSNFLIKINNRKLLNALVKFLNIDPFFADDIFRTLDKIERLGEEEVRKKLILQGEPEIDQRQVPPNARCLGLSEAVADKIMEFVAISGTTQEVIDRLKSYFGDFAEAEEGISELENIITGLQNLGIPESKYTLDLSIARGLGYYTGPVFETVLLDLPSFGSVFSGGRFDGLIGRFTEHSIPATGASIGVDRLFAALEQLKLVDLKPSNSEVLVVVFDKNQLPEYMKIASELRHAGLNAELYMGEESLSRQFRYADLQGIPVAVIAGPDELAADEVSVKRLTTGFGEAGKQQRIKRAEMVTYVRSLLAK
jgi:histidyl-tRNA synthetase